PVSRDRTKPGRKFFGIAHPPASFPRLDECILNYVFGFLAVLQNAVGNGEERATLGADDHFECFPIAENSCPKGFAFAGLHRSIRSLDVRPSKSARRILRNRQDRTVSGSG